MKVLLINGSPNEKGCTYTALSEVAKGIAEQGVETEIFHIGSSDIKGCIGCRKCTADGCVFDDDIVNIAHKKIREADGIVIGSPVYFASPNGSLLAFLDRVFYSARGILSGKPGACVVSARRGGTTAALDVLNKYITICSMPLVSSTYWNMVHGNRPEEVAQDLEGLQTMRNLGRNMAWLIRNIDAGRKAGIEPPEQERKTATNFIRK